MGNNVFANGREISCKAADGKAIAAFPDVAFTPPQTPATPPGVPIPYPNTAFAKDTAKGSKKVKISGKEVMLKNKSYFKTSTGNEAGSAPKKGIMTSKIKGKVYFNAWSMDVKFEGQNVTRHLDLTTHNHGSNPNTGPWPYADSQAVGPGGDCHDESKAIKDSGKCSDPVDEDVSPACCSVPERKCVMVAKKDDKKKCCDGQTTGHHPIPVQEFSKTGKPRGRLLDELSETTYDQEAAPTICAEGQYHREWQDTPPYQLKEHGMLGNAYKAATIEKGIKGKKNVPYSDLRDCAKESVHQVLPQCSEKCIAKQLDTYHCDEAKIPKNAPVCRSSQQSKYAQYDKSKAASA